MDVLVTGGDTELGRAIAHGFHDAGHTVTLAGSHGPELEVSAKELDAQAVICDTTDPDSMAQARGLFPHHLDTIVNVPAPRWQGGDPRGYTMTEQAKAWRSAFDTTMVSAVLTIATVGDHLRSGGSIISVLPDNPLPGSADAAVKAALADWTAGQASVFGTRGITVNVVAAGAAASPGYDGMTRLPTDANTEIARVATFLTSPSARHITGQTLHVGHGALASFG